jgi:hypothetical protein
MTGIGDIAPEISGTDLVTDKPWSLKAQADKDVMLAFTAITGSSPFDLEASALAAVWSTLNGKTVAPFTMAIIAGYKQGSPPQETVPDLKVAIQKFQITCPVVLSPQSQIAYTIPEPNKIPALFCLHWNAKAGGYKVGSIFTGIKSFDTKKITQDILAFLDACGVKLGSGDDGTVSVDGGGGGLEAQPPTVVESPTLPVFLQLFGGVTGDGGGWGLTFGGRPIPIPPWGPLQFLGPAGLDAVVGLTVAGLAGQMTDGPHRDQVWQAGIQTAKAALDQFDESSAGAVSFSLRET